MSPCNFLKPLWRLFSDVEHEDRLQEYSKCREYQILLKITIYYHNKTININEELKSFIMLFKQASWHCKFGACQK